MAHTKNCTISFLDQKLVTQINNEKRVSTLKTTITDDDPVLQYESREDDCIDRDECSKEGSYMTEDESMYHKENETETTTEDEQEVLETHSKRYVHVCIWPRLHER